MSSITNIFSGFATLWRNRHEPEQVRDFMLACWRALLVVAVITFLCLLGFLARGLFTNENSAGDDSLLVPRGDGLLDKQKLERVLEGFVERSQQHEAFRAGALQITDPSQ